MSKNLWRYLREAYFNTRYYFASSPKAKHYIQIDDQDDTDNITEFCNIFVNFKNNSTFEIELIGKMPITDEIADLAEIYRGTVDYNQRKINMILKPEQVEAVSDLAALIKKTTPMGDCVDNAQWHLISTRTICSLHRFVRIIKEFLSVKQTLLI